MIRVLVSARSPIVRAGLEAVIRDAEGLTLAASTDPEKLASGFVDAQPDTVLAALERNQEDLAEEIAALAAETAVILVANEPQPALIADALRAGVRAVLPADSAPAEIVAAVTAAAAGFVVLHPEDVPALVSAPVLAERASEGIGQQLTPREIEVLRLMADGEANKGIAWRLGISDHTVKFHVASIMSKLRASSRTEAVTLGIRRGLIPL